LKAMSFPRRHLRWPEVLLLFFRRDHSAYFNSKAAGATGVLPNRLPVFFADKAKTL
jgi:hypothetical protein